MKREPKVVDHIDRQTAAQDLHRSFVVEASAGTGKTTLLVERIINLIIEKDARPEEIVAITFTERAAAELKSRLQEKLTKKLLEAKDTQREKIARSLSEIDRMQVSTIHSFCATLLRQRSVEAAIDPRFEVADELEASLIADSVWEEWLAEKMDEGNEAIRRAILLGSNLTALRNLAWTMANNQDVLDYLPEQIPIDAMLKDFIGQAWKLIDEFEGYHTAVDELRSELETLRGIKDSEQLQIHIFTRFAFPRLPRKRKDDEASAFRARLEDLKALFDQLRTTIAHNAIAGLAQCLLTYITHYNRAKESNGVLDFHDLLFLARNLLRDHPDARNYFRKRYKYILVDEFQDTDPLQAEIVFYLAETDGKNAARWQDVSVEQGRLFLVGDPKQSIYRFRRADIEMYATAKGLLPPSSSLNIQMNFRSAPPIIDFVNSIFKELIREPEEGNYQPSYVPLVCGRDPETLPRDAAVVLLRPPPKLPEPANADERRETEAAYIASFIRRLVDHEKWEVWDKKEGQLRPVAFKDIAILLRSHTPLTAIEDALRLYEIDYRVIGGKYFYTRQEVEDLIAVLRSIEDPYDQVSLVRALRSPFFGISDEELLLFNRELFYLTDATGTSLDQPFKLLKKLHEIRNNVSLDRLLGILLTETKANVTYLLKPNGEQRLANLQKIGEIGRALSERGIKTFAGIVRWLAEMKQREAEEGEAPTVEIGDNFVRVLTIHKAKGLEFPVVILADLAARSTSREHFIISRRDESVAISIGRSTSGLVTTNWEELSEHEALRSDAEERRLLYVAMTRARDYLVIPYYWMAETEHDRSGSPRRSSFLSYLSDTLSPSGPKHKSSPSVKVISYPTKSLDVSRVAQPAFRMKIDSGRADQKTQEFEEAMSKWRERIQTIRDQLTEGKTIMTATEALSQQKPRPTAISSEITGLLYGQMVHELLEIVDWTCGEVEEEWAASKIKDICDDENLIRKAIHSVRKILASELIRRIVQSQSYYKEVPFAYAKNGTIFEGKIDVVFIEGDDVILVDFKTDRVAGRDVVKEAHRYKPQIEIYSDAIEACLGRAPKEVILFFTEPCVEFRVSMNR